MYKNVVTTNMAESINSTYVTTRTHNDKEISSDDNLFAYDDNTILRDDNTFLKFSISANIF